MPHITCNKMGSGFREERESCFLSFLNRRIKPLIPYYYSSGAGVIFALGTSKACLCHTQHAIRWEVDLEKNENLASCSKLNRRIKPLIPYYYSSGAGVIFGVGTSKAYLCYTQHAIRWEVDLEKNENLQRESCFIS
jgi:hypothetical protein